MQGEMMAMQMMDEAGRTAHATSSRAAFASAALSGAVFVCARFAAVPAVAVMISIGIVVVLLITGRVVTPVATRGHYGRRAA